MFRLKLCALYHDGNPLHKLNFTRIFGGEGTEEVEDAYKAWMHKMHHKGYCLVSYVTMMIEMPLVRGI